MNEVLRTLLEDVLRVERDNLLRQATTRDQYAAKAQFAADKATATAERIAALEEELA